MSEGTERRKGERRKADRRTDIDAARKYLGMERRMDDRRVHERRRSQTAGTAS